MILRPPRSTRTDTLFPYTTLFRSLSGIGRQAVDLVFVAGVELAAPGGPFASHHAVSADHRVGAAAALLVEHQQVVAKIVEGVEVAARCGHLRRRPGRPGLVEHPVAQHLGGPDLDRTSTRLNSSHSCASRM